MILEKHTRELNKPFYREKLFLYFERSKYYENFRSI